MIQLPKWLGTLMLDNAVARAPIEACGLVSKNGVGQWSGFFPVANAARSKSRFVMDPAALYPVVRRVESTGGEIAGYFHSHPSGPATPSEVDVAEWPDRSWLSFIAFPCRHGSDHSEWTLRAFGMATVRPEPVQVRWVSTIETDPPRTLRS